MDKKIKTRRQNMHSGEWRPVLIKLPWLLIIPAFWGLAKLAALYPDITEKYYSSGVFPVISALLGMLSALATGVSIAEMLIYAGVVAIVVLVLINVIGLIAGRLRFARFMNFIVSFCLTAGILFGLFYVDWGFNYSRPSLYERMELDVEPRPVEELQTLSLKLAKEAADLRAEVDEDDNGVFTLIGGYRPYFDSVPDAYVLLGRDNELFSRRVYPAKGVLASVGMSYAGISGIFIPFTAEANVNVDQPPLLLLSSAAHETAHYMGIAREDEANFVSYLACSYSDIPAIEYSGVMLALINCMNKLYASDKDMYYAVRETYTDGMNRDLANYNAYWDSFEGPIEETVNNINDNYLKFNQQDDGVKSYGMMVDLLLAYYAQD